MMRAFERDWQGGTAERLFRRRHGNAIDALPWGSLRPEDYPAVLVDRARASWTEGAHQEYCTAAAFAELLRALLAVGAPIDLIGMAGGFIADEMLHVELNARMAMELGGAAPYLVDFDRLTPATTPGASPFERANELIVRICCVGEGMSVPLLGGTARAATHALTRGVLERIVRDEAPHARLGWLYLDWAAPRLCASERQRLASVAMAALQDYAPYWQDLTSHAENGVTREGFLLEHVHALGWMESRAYAQLATEAVVSNIAQPLRRHGIELPTDELRQQTGLGLAHHPR